MDTMIQRRSTQFNMRIDPELKEAAERAATDDRRSLSSLVEKLLTDYCREGGYLTKEGRLPPKQRRR
jgi:hypothetical protein